MPDTSVKLYKFLKGLPNNITRIDDNVARIDAQLRNIRLSPIERHVYISSISNQHGLFNPIYDEWRIKRINKILEVYGIDYFKNKNVLELGSGYGDIGAFFADLGANVLCLDGREQNVIFANLKHHKLDNFKCLQFNLENEFTDFGKFDLIINFGLLYHLKNLDEHLNCCFKVSDDIFLETVVCDSTDPYKIFYCEENKNHNYDALEGIGSRPSPFYIERIANEHNYDVSRYFTADLNVWNDFVYDWEHRNDNRLGEDFN